MGLSLEYENIIGRIAQLVHNSIDLQKVMENTVDSITDNVKNVDNTMFYMVEENHAVLKAYKSLPENYIKKAGKIPYGKGITWKSIIDNEPIYCSDVDNDPTVGLAGKQSGLKSALIVPINYLDHVVGTLIINSYKVNAFDKEEIELLKEIAKQIEVAINNAKQADNLLNISKDLTEKNKDLENLITITQTVHRYSDLEEVYELGLDIAVEQENVAMAFIYLVNDDRSEAVLQDHRNLPKSYQEGASRIPKGKGITWKVIESGEMLHIKDVQQEPDIGRAGGVLGHHGILGIPITQDSETIGVLWFLSHKGEEFKEKEKKLLVSIGDQIALAISKAKLYSDLSKRYSYEKIIRIINENINSSLNLERVLENAVDTMLENISFIEQVAICFVEDDEAVIKVHRGYPDWFIEKVKRMPKGKGFTWWTIQNNQIRHCPDVDNDSLIGEYGRQIGTKSYVGIPLHLGDKTIGALCINSFQKNAFKEEDIQLLETVSKQLEIAIKKAQNSEALIKSEVRYRSLFDNNPLMCFTIDINGIVLSVNEAGVKDLGYELSELVGQPVLSVFHPDDKEAVKKSMEKALKNSDEFNQWEFRKLRKDGSILWVKEDVRILSDFEGNQVFLIVCEDITARKKAQDELRESEEKYRTIIENTEDLISEVDVNGKILYLSPNQTEISGYSDEELIGTIAFDYIHQDDLANVLKEFSQAIMGRTSGQATYRFLHKSGEWRWFDTTGKAYEMANGEIKGVLISRDITERKKLVEEQLRSQKLESLGVLAGGIAHDFNNLLTGILGNVTLAKLQSTSPEVIVDLLEEAEKASLRARDLTYQLLTFSKGGAPVKKVVSSFGQLIQDSAEFLLSGSNIKCNIIYDDTLQNVEIDTGQISQVIDNLVINAQQAMPSGGSLDITLSNIIIDSGLNPNLENGEYVKVEVEDNGIGMPKDHIERVFDPYFSTKQMGSGIGLTTVYSIIKNHNGHIEVESELGVGTKFTIYLPSTKKVELKNVEDRQLTKDTGRILVMDDDEVVRDVAGQMLVQLGYEVDFAEDGKEALEMYKNAKRKDIPYDVVIMDLTIPGGMGGKETIAEMLKYDSGVKAIVSSGYSNDPVLSSYSDYGFRGIVSKPYQIDELGKTIQSILN